MQRLVFIIFIVILFLTAPLAHGQIPVFLSSTTSQADTVGSRLTYKVKEGIRKSSGLDLVDRIQDGFIRVHIVTLDPGEGSHETNGYQTVYSIVWTMRTFHQPPVEAFLTSYVGICGVNRIDSCAETIVATTDEYSSAVKGLIQSAIEKNKR